MIAVPDSAKDLPHPLGMPSTADRERMLAVARGDRTADLLITGARTLCVYTGEWLDGPVAISEDRVVGVGTHRDAVATIDLTDHFLVPGFIDAHVHIESSKLTPARFAEAVVPRGTTAIVAEPHEIGNVLGIAGVKWFMDAAQGIPLDVYGMAPSCVPASPYESSGATIDAQGIEELLRHPWMLGVGEMMNYPGVIAGNADQLAKLSAHGASHVDGHAPGVGGADLDAYVSTGIGSDHESTTLAEALDKRRRGMWILMREASNARNLRDLIPLVKQYGPAFCALCTDDREPDELVRVGHMDELIRICIAEGLAPEVAYTLGSLHPALAHGLRWHGAIAPGMLANLVAVTDLESVTVSDVWHRGKHVVRSGVLHGMHPTDIPDWVTTTMHQAPLTVDDLVVSAGQNEADSPAVVRVIELETAQLITYEAHDNVLPVSGAIAADPATDRAKLVVAERHRSTGRVGVGFVRGFHLTHGAIGSTVAHDAHNTVIAGTNDADIVAASARLTKLQGGVVVVKDGVVLAELALPIAGILSNSPAADVADAMDKMHHAAASIGVDIEAPFMVLSFLALSVIPSLKLTDRGYVDVNAFQLVPTVIPAGSAVLNSAR